jgi:Cu-processing system ATP-binding protein
MIEIKGLTKNFGRQHVLQGVDLEIAPGRVTAVVGHNGAGKTTLIKAILGLSRPDGGTITIDGTPVNGDPAYRARIGYMPQIARFPENLSAGELLDMIKDLRGNSVAHVDEELISRLELADELRKPLRVLSGGTRQKVNAVIAFLFSPDLLILDEPTAGLDPVSSSTLKDKILAARAAGRTVVITSHVMSELEELADDLAFLIDGRVQFAGPLQRLKIETRQLNLERAIAHLMRRGAGKGEGEGEAA